MRTERDDGDRLPRCCDGHDDWPTLTEHVRRQFPELSPHDVAEELRTAREAVRTINLDEDELLTAELIVRNRLMIRAGNRPDVARLDPETHAGRKASDD